MCKNVEAVLEEKIEMPLRCEVTMDGEGFVSDDFVCIKAKENGDTSIFYNTDALTLGMAIRMVTRAYVDAMKQLSEEEREQVLSVLNTGGSNE